MNPAQPYIGRWGANTGPEDDYDHLGIFRNTAYHGDQAQDEHVASADASSGPQVRTHAPKNKRLKAKLARILAEAMRRFDTIAQHTLQVVFERWRCLQAMTATEASFAAARTKL